MVRSGLLDSDSTFQALRISGTYPGLRPGL